MAAQASEIAMVLPGDRIDTTVILPHPKHSLRLGPGLRHLPPDDLVTTIAGQVVSDTRKNLIWVENNGGRYKPAVGDLVIGTVQRSGVDVYYVQLSDYTACATLPQLSFEKATKSKRPNLAPGSLVYARVSLANRHMDPEIECVSPATGRADGLGPLAGGMVYGVSLGMARRLLMRRSLEEGGVAVLEELGAAGLVFETAIGRNGKMWVGSESVRTVLTVGRAVQETDEKGLGVEQQKKLVGKLVREMMS